MSAFSSQGLRLIQNPATLQHSAAPQPLSHEPTIFDVITSFPESLPFVLGPQSNLNVLSQRGYTPLTLSASLNNFTAAMELMKHGANPYQPDAHGQTALDYALGHGNQRLVSTLLICMGFSHNSTAVAQLTQSDLRQAVQNILSAGIPEFVSATTERGRILHRLYERQRLESNLTVVDKLPYQIMQHWVKGGLLTKMQQSLNQFLKNRKNNLLDWIFLKKGLSSFMVSSEIVFAIRKYCISELLWQGGSQNIPRLIQTIFTQGPLPPFLMQQAILNFELYSLLNWGPYLDSYPTPPTGIPGINDQSTEGYTLLMVAIQEQDRDAINTYLANPALNINLQAKCGLTALFAAIQLEDVDTVQAVLTTQAGKVDFNLKTPAGKTALDIAIEKNALEVVLLLSGDQMLDFETGQAEAEAAPPLASATDIDTYFSDIAPVYLPSLSPPPPPTSFPGTHPSTQDGEPAAKLMRVGVA